MKTIKVTVSTAFGFVGGNREATFEVDDDATEDKINEMATAAMISLIDWGWCVEDE